MNELRIDLTWLDDFFDFGNYVFGGSGHVGIEVSGSLIEIQISESVSLLGLYQSEITENGFLFDVLFAVVDFTIFRL